MHAITIRPYRSDDVESLVALFRSSVRQIALGDYTETQVLAWAPDLSDLERDGHVDMLYVHPAFKRRGVARALLSHIERAQTVVTRDASMTNYRMEKRLVSASCG
jgi:putative acetyltransferase